MSVDGGRTFKAAPLAGVPAKAQPILAPLIVESDGSLVVAFTTNDGQAAKVYSWKLGQASWRMFAPTPNGQLARLLRAGTPGADETFWAVIQDNGVQQDNTMLYTFTVSSYQP